MLYDLLSIAIVLLFVWCGIGGLLNDKYIANKTKSPHNGIWPDPDQP